MSSIAIFTGAIPKRCLMQNINTIGKCSSHRLAGTLTSDMADAIIRYRDLNGGEFENWDDLYEKVHGLGVVKLGKLQSAGFFIERNGTFADEIAKRSVTYRHFPEMKISVHSLKAQTWLYRDNRDNYTNMRQCVMLKHAETNRAFKEEVDHVIEAQIFNAANKSVATSDGMGIAYRTRGTQEVLVSMFNNVKNLNVTTNYVNQKKKGPFESFNNDVKRGGSVRKIEDILCRSRARVLLQDGTWNRIEESIVKVYDDLEEDAGAIRAEAQRRHAQRLLEEVNEMLRKMGIKNE